MTPKEFNFMVAMLEAASSFAYDRGKDSANTGHPKPDFKMSRAERMRLETELLKATKSR